MDENSGYSVQQLHYKFRLAVLISISFIVFVTFLVFTIFRLSQRHWLIAALDGAIGLISLMSIVYVWRTGNIDRMSKIQLYFVCGTGIVLIHLIGNSALDWAYSLYVASFLFSKRQHAIAASGVMLVAVIIDNAAFTDNLNRIVFVSNSLLICSYAYAFAYQAEILYKKLEHLASHDTLTGVYNRRSFQEELVSTHELFQRNANRPVGMLVLDIDHFKGINDTWGHEIGDKILIRLAHLVKTSVRKTDRFFRYGGEEFVVLVTDTTPSTLQTMADNLRRKVAEKLAYQGEHFTISIGGAILRSNESARDWFSRADAALYQAKDAGRNQVVIYADSSTSSATNATDK